MRDCFGGFSGHNVDRLLWAENARRVRHGFRAPRRDPPTGQRQSGGRFGLARSAKRSQIGLELERYPIRMNQIETHKPLQCMMIMRSHAIHSVRIPL